MPTTEIEQPEYTRKVLTTMEVKLKENIEGTLVEIDTVKGTENIVLDPDVKAVLGQTITVDMVKVSGAYEAIMFTLDVADGYIVYIHPEWIETILGEPILLTSSFQTKANIKINNSYVVDSTTGELLALADLDVCSECGEPLDTDLDICSTCLDNYYNMRNYSFTPDYNFIGEQKGKLEQTNPAWYGIELEYGLRGKLEMSKLLYKNQDRLIIKSDSSIKGGEYRAELVSHPMSFAALMADDSWVNELSKLEAENLPESNGCHIHISRTAFKSDKAFNKFKFLMLTNKPLIEAIGGRQIGQYSKFETFDNPRTSSIDKIGGEKYLLINQAHTHTVECRYMASSNDPKTVKRYLQFLDAMVKYTSYHSTTASYKGFAAYVAKYATKYAILADFVKSSPEVFETGEVSIKAIKRKTVSILDLKIGDYKSVISLQVKNTATGATRQGSIRSDLKIHYHDNSDKLREVFGNYLEENEEAFVTYLS